MTESIKNLLTRIFDRQMVKIIKKHNPIIIAVAGSVGKTTTKLAIAQVLSQSLKVRYQDGNYNTPISLPFIFIGRSMPNIYNPFGWFLAWLHGERVLHSKFDFDYVVIELGTDAPGDIVHFKNLFRPYVTVISAVAEEHMEFFESLEAVAKEELGISEFSEILLVNADDIDQKYLDKYIPAGKEVHSYGFNHAEYKISYKQHHRGYRVKISLGGDEFVEEEIKTLAEHNLKAVAAAVAVADLLEVPKGEIEKAIAKIKPTPGRMQILKGINNSTIIDDSYNSSPIAVEAALKTLYNFDAKQRIAILGMMNELGDYSKEAHKRVGNYLDSQKIDLLITIGKDANEIIAKFGEDKGIKTVRCDSPYKAAQAAKDNLIENAVILAKGSQNGVFAEEAVRLLLANKDDVSKLVRQNKFWINKKKSQFKDYQ
jgi:UDP-N-acetylmuramoyl-tripeptide--D-alanyl-D-alanine ligase